MSFDPTQVTEDEADAIWIALHGLREIGSLRTRILGLDLGAKFGWALVDADGNVIESGWYDTVRRGESDGMGRLRFKRALHDLIESANPTAVWYEDPKGRFRGHGGKNIIRQIGVLEAELTEREVPYGSVHQTTLKRFATGKGNASKDDMRAALAERFVDK